MIIPSNNSAEHTFIHTFFNTVTFEIVFSELSESVIVNETPPDDDYGDDESTGMGMLMWVLPLFAVVTIALLLFMMKGKKGSVVEEEASDDTT